MDLAIILPGQGGLSGPPGSSTLSTSKPLTERDLDFLDNDKVFSYISNISPLITGSDTLMNGSNEFFGFIDGVSERYAQMQELEISEGRFFSEGDVSAARSVAVIGPNVAEDLFPTTALRDVPGESLSLGSTRYSVAGVLESRPSQGFDEPDDEVYIPYTSADQIFPAAGYSAIQFTVSDVDLMDLATSQVKERLAKFRKVDVEEPDFTIITAEQFLDIAFQITDILTGLLAAIAAISLLVGGIGISNIMLVSVVERTKEIGLRKAVGAQRKDILLQFLTEAVILTMAGGALGTGLGIFLAWSISHFAALSYNITLNSILLAAGVSIGIGLVFGLVPAFKASKLDPIDALRYE